MLVHAAVASNSYRDYKQVHVQQAVTQRKQTDGVCRHKQASTAGKPIGWYRKLEQQIGTTSKQIRQAGPTNKTGAAGTNSRHHNRTFSNHALQASKLRQARSTHMYSSQAPPLAVTTVHG